MRITEKLVLAYRCEFFNSSNRNRRTTAEGRVLLPNWSRRASVRDQPSGDMDRRARPATTRLQHDGCLAGTTVGMAKSSTPVTYTVNVAQVNSLSGTVTLEAVGLPGGHRIWVIINR